MFGEPRKTEHAIIGAEKPSMIKSLWTLIGINTLIARTRRAEYYIPVPDTPKNKPKPARTNKHGQHKFNVDGIEVYAMNLKNAKRKAQNIKAQCQ